LEQAEDDSRVILMSLWLGVAGEERGLVCKEAQLLQSRKGGWCRMILWRWRHRQGCLCYARKGRAYRVHERPLLFFQGNRNGKGWEGAGRRVRVSYKLETCKVPPGYVRKEWTYGYDVIYGAGAKVMCLRRFISGNLYALVGRA